MTQKQKWIRTLLIIGVAGAVDATAHAFSTSTAAYISQHIVGILTVLLAALPIYYFQLDDRIDELQQQINALETRFSHAGD